ncbi:hypothetical protein [Streptomyces sp. NPDC001492]
MRGLPARVLGYGTWRLMPPTVAVGTGSMAHARFPPSGPLKPP